MVEEHKARLERLLAEFVQLGRSNELAHENVGDFEYGKEFYRKYRLLFNEHFEAAFSQIRKRLTRLGDIKNNNYMRFSCRRALFAIVDQAQFSSCGSVYTAELDTLLDKEKSLGQEFTDNLKTTNKHVSSDVHDIDYRNDLVLMNETIPRVCRTLSTRIAYLQHQQKITSAKEATGKLRRDAMPSSDEVRSAEPSTRSPDAIDPVRSAELSAHNRDANEPVPSAEPSAAAALRVNLCGALITQF